MLSYGSDESRRYTPTEVDAAHASLGEITSSLAKLKQTVASMQRSLSSSPKGAFVRGRWRPNAGGARGGGVD